MAVAGSLTYDTKIDKSGFKKGLNSITNSVKDGGTKVKSIVAALGITKMIGAAFNMINNSLDGAISRIDTMNNFPKVMSNLGIGAKESEEAIKELSERLKGIPTTLDSAALSVERFTSKNGDVKKSVEIFTAINNALLAGGASSEIQESALEQLSQAYAKGKPDMVEWRSIQTAMPAQLKQVAQAMGMTTDQLGEGLREGNIEMDKFINTIVKLNKEGTEQFQSFEKQAKNATGGIKTSITNAKTAIVRGVGNIVTSLDEILKDKGLGGISKIVSNIGNIAEKVLTKTGELMRNFANDFDGTLQRVTKFLVNDLPGKISSSMEILISKIPQAILIVQKIVISLIETINANLPVIIQEGAQIVLVLAKGISQALPSLIPIITNAIIMIYMSLLDNIDTIIDAGIELILALIDGMINALPIIIEKVPEIIEKIVTILVSNTPKLIAAGIKIIIALVKGIIQGLPKLLKASDEIKIRLINIAIDCMEKVKGKVEQIFTNIWKSISNFFTKSWNLINNYFTGTILVGINKLIENIWNIIQKGWDSLMIFFSQTIPQCVQKIIQWFDELPYRIGYQLGQTLGSFIQFGINIGNWIKTDLPQIVQNIVNWFAQLRENIYSWLCQTINDINAWGENLYNAASTKVSNTVNSIGNWFSQLPRKS